MALMQACHQREDLLKSTPFLHSTQSYTFQVLCIACKDSPKEQLTCLDSWTLTARILLKKLFFFSNKRTRLQLQIMQFFRRIKIHWLILRYQSSKSNQGGGIHPLVRRSSAISHRIILWSQNFLTLSINIPSRRQLSHFFYYLERFSRNPAETEPRL